MRMKWHKQGLIFAPEGNYDWMRTHAQVPLVDPVGENVLRVYFGTRDNLNRTVTAYIEIEADDPKHILYVHHKPVLGLGALGCFDDSGAMPSWIVRVGDLKYLYYIGWNVGTTVAYRNAIGLAVSRDGGKSFARLYDGPIMDRTHREPHFCACPCVIREGSLWRMWYLSCVGWQVYNGRPEPCYHTKYAESSDGIHWRRDGIVCIDFKSSQETGIVRPTIIKEDHLYKMWYSYRGIEDYRTNPQHSYRIGYAESSDGIRWTRKDEEVGIDISEEGWDSVMIAYPYVYEHKGKKYLFHNGNGFGRSGFGYAVLENGA
jgi:hypothetical protein